ncbi:hypothetical protein IE53DRAFT_405053 [Violaceomyces palustris]|uniref:Uncharacterized protein n=1 Tax=Violaceomyces palustris TaxID=1673888 RepID=A0ACD0P3C5_9BASI|nr:hypothetical protein IE53DRAFT_405053 [Violaceomyces palustris]
MAGDGLDDELLALAGGPDSPMSSHSLSDDGSGSPSSNHRKRFSGKYSSKSKSGGAGKKRRKVDVDSDDDAEANSGDESEVENPYPLQGIYKDEKDMYALLEMNELDREEVLSRRRDEISQRQQRAQLAAMVRSQKAAGASTAKKVSSSSRPKKSKSSKSGSKKSSSRRRRSSSDIDDSLSDSDDEDQDAGGTDDDADGSDYSAGMGVSGAAKARKKKAVGATDTKTAKLSELRKKRKEKASGVRSRADSDDGGSSPKKRGYLLSSSDGDSSEEDDYESEEEGARRKGYSASASRRQSRGGREREERENELAKKEPPSLKDLNAVRVGRDSIERKLFAPRWKEAIIGSFIRLSWGTRDRADGKGKEEVHRIHQILDVHEKPGKYYDLSRDKSGRWTNVFVNFEWNGKDHEIDLRLISNSDFTENERERYLASFQDSKQRMPRKRELEEKADELEAFFTSPLSEVDIQRMLQAKKKSKNAAIAAGYGQIPGGGPNPSSSSSPSATKFGGSMNPNDHSDSLYGSPRDASSQQRSKYDQQVMAEMNDRNRRMEKERINEAERRAAKAKKLALANSSASLNGSDTPPISTSTPVRSGTPVQPVANGEGQDANTPITSSKRIKQPTSLINSFKIDVDLGDF